MVFQIVSGTLAGKYWYWSEEIIPNVGVGHTVAAGQTVATFAPSETASNSAGGRCLLAGRSAGSKATPKGMARPLGADFRYLLEQLGANPGDGAGRSLPNAWKDRVPGAVMRKLLLIALVALSPIKPEGENRH